MRKNLLLLLFALIVCLSCKEHIVDDVLQVAESNINEAPDYVLDMLDTLDRDKLSGRKHQAKFSLLYSIALDKCYIDLQSDSIIAPAVSYYENHGTKSDRFLCHYYQARIFENQGDYDNVLLSLAKAEALDTSKISPDKLCLLYALKGYVYHDAWRISEAIEAYETACSYSFAAGMFRHYAYYCLMLADLHRFNADSAESAKWMRNAEKYADSFTSAEKHEYSRLVILNMIDSKVDPDECLYYVDQYINSCPESSMIKWSIAAMAYLYVGDPYRAHDMLRQYAQYQDVSVESGYYGILADVLEQIGDYQGSLAAHRIFADLMKQRDVARHLSDVKLIEERFAKELLQNRQKFLIFSGAMLIIVLLTVSSSITFRWVNERKKYKSDISELEQEFISLSLLKESLNCSTNEELMRILGLRIKALSAFFQKPIPDSLSKVAQQIDNLKENKNSIVDSIGLLYAVNYPDFVSELRRHNLTSAEIGYCCLYILGLNIPEAGKVIGKVSSIYNVNSSIRKKLDISGSNLDKWLQKRFVELCETPNGERIIHGN